MLVGALRVFRGLFCLGTVQRALCGKRARILPHPRKQSTGLFFVRCGAPPCSIPRTGYTKKHSSISWSVSDDARGNLPGSLFFTHRLLWNNASGICQLFLYRINYSSANSTTNLASVAAMASWSLFSKFVFCSILMTWYFTVDGSMPSSFAISL